MADETSDEPIDTIYEWNRRLQACYPYGLKGELGVRGPTPHPACCGPMPVCPAPSIECRPIVGMHRQDYYAPFTFENPPLPDPPPEVPEGEEPPPLPQIEFDVLYEEREYTPKRFTATGSWSGSYSYEYSGECFDSFNQIVGSWSNNFSEEWHYEKVTWVDPDDPTETEQSRFAGLYLDFYSEVITYCPGDPRDDVDINYSGYSCSSAYHDPDYDPDADPPQVYQCAKGNTFSGLGTSTVTEPVPACTRALCEEGDKTTIVVDNYATSQNEGYVEGDPKDVITRNTTEKELGAKVELKGAVTKESMYAKAMADGAAEFPVREAAYVAAKAAYINAQKALMEAGGDNTGHTALEAARDAALIELNDTDIVSGLGCGPGARTAILWPLAPNPYPECAAVAWSALMFTAGATTVSTKWRFDLNGHSGTYFHITWDEIFYPYGDGTEESTTPVRLKTDQTVTWTGPGDEKDEYSDSWYTPWRTLDAPEEPGEVLIRNIRFHCYRSDYGMIEQTTGVQTDF